MSVFLLLLLIRTMTHSVFHVESLSCNYYTLFWIQGTGRKRIQGRSGGYRSCPTQESRTASWVLHRGSSQASTNIDLTVASDSHISFPLFEIRRITSFLRDVSIFSSDASADSMRGLHFQDAGV